MFINFMHTILVPSEYPKMKALQEHKVSSVPTHTTGIQQKPIHTWPAILLPASMFCKVTKLTHMLHQRRLKEDITYKLLLIGITVAEC